MNDEQKKQVKDLIEQGLKSRNVNAALKAAVSDGGLKSRKLWITIGGSAVVIGAVIFLGVSADLGMSVIAGLLGSYNLGNGLAKRAAP